jgi:hypothetical protein
MTGVLTGLLLIGIGAVGFFIVYIGTRKAGTPFVQKDVFGGYTGVMGLAGMAFGALIILVSIVSAIAS